MVWFLPIRKTDNMGEPSWGALCKRLNRAGADYVWDRLSASASPLGVDTFMVFTNCAYERPPYSRPFIPGDLEDALNGILIADDRKCPIKASPAWSLPENKTGEYRKIQCQNADPERTLKVLHAFGIKSRSRGPRGKLTYTISWNIPEEWSEEDHIYQDFLASLRHGSIIRTPRPLASHSHLNFSENKRKTDMLVEYENLDFSTLESADECNLILTG